MPPRTNARTDRPRVKAIPNSTGNNASTGAARKSESNKACARKGVPTGKAVSNLVPTAKGARRNISGHRMATAEGWNGRNRIVRRRNFGGPAGLPAPGNKSNADRRPVMKAGHPHLALNTMDPGISRRTGISAHSADTRLSQPWKADPKRAAIAAMTAPARLPQWPPIAANRPGLPEPLEKKSAPDIADHKTTALKAVEARMTQGWAGLVPFIVLPLRRMMRVAKDTFSSN